MPRRPNTRPTLIYWLFDMRPETLIEWPNGLPFYCGKTVMDPQIRLIRHKTSSRKFPTRPISRRLGECGDLVRIQIMETVPVGGDWVAREKFQIYSLRTLYPNTVNVASGGQGAPGLIHTVEARAKISAAQSGRKLSPEWCANIGRAHKGRIISHEQRVKIRSALTGRKLSEEHRANVSKAMKGMKHSAEHVAKRSAARKGQTISAEQRSKISATLRMRYAKSTHAAN